MLDDGVFSLKLSSNCRKLGSRSSPSLRGRRRTPQLKLSVLSPCKNSQEEVELVFFILSEIKIKHHGLLQRFRSHIQGSQSP